MDYYCSWLGTCNSDGTACLCFEPEHRSSTDRCSTWSPSVSVPGPGDGTCSSGDRGYCFNQGFCNAAGNGCVCDDPLHFWSSDRCETSHLGGELATGECCVPGLSDYYCGWLGTCDSSGLNCICDDSAHRSPSERCSIYHDILPPVAPDSSTCPALIDLSAALNTKSSGSSDSSKYPYGWPYWTAVIAFLLVVVVVGAVLYKFRPPTGGATRRSYELKAVQQSEEEQGSVIVQMPTEPARSTFHMLNPLEDTTQL